MKASEAKKICEKWLESVSEISIRWFLGSARERQYFSPVLEIDDAGIISDVEMEKTFDGGIGVLSIYARKVDVENFVFSITILLMIAGITCWQVNSTRKLNYLRWKRKQSDSLIRL